MNPTVSPFEKPLTLAPTLSTTPTAGSTCRQTQQQQVALVTYARVQHNKRCQRVLALSILQDPHRKGMSR